MCTLSKREKQIIALVADGFTSFDIARQLGVSYKTVRNHLTNIYRKLNVSGRGRAIVIYTEWRLFNAD